jgi:hypothetical protein
LFVPRDKQGAGRHDIPERDGVLYCSTVVISAVAEAIKSFRGRTIRNDLFRRPDGLVVSVAGYELDDGIKIVDLNDPQNLAKRRLTPAQIATFDRKTTQGIARRFYDEGIAGFSWWSTLEAGWRNVTLFESRVKKHLKVKSGPTALHVRLPQVQDAARHLVIDLK